MKEINKRPESQPEKEMATHSSILAWKIQDTGDLWATVYGVARVGHDVATKPPPPESQQTMVRARQGEAVQGPRRQVRDMGFHSMGQLFAKHRPGVPSGHRKGGRQRGKESRVRKRPASQDSGPSNSASVPVAWPTSISYQAF